MAKGFHNFIGSGLDELTSTSATWTSIYRGLARVVRSRPGRAHLYSITSLARTSKREGTSSCDDYDINRTMHQIGNKISNEVFCSSSELPLEHHVLPSI